MIKPFSIVLAKEGEPIAERENPGKEVRYVGVLASSYTEFGKCRRSWQETGRLILIEKDEPGEVWYRYREDLCMLSKTKQFKGLLVDVTATYDYEPTPISTRIRLWEDNEVVRNHLKNNPKFKIIKEFTVEYDE